MVKGRGRKEREVFGRFEVLRHPKGGATFFGPGLRGKGQYVPSDQHLRGLYQPGRNWSDQLGVLKKAVHLRGIMETDDNRPSNRAGRIALGLPEPSCVSLIPLEQIQGKIASFWPSKSVQKYMNGERVQLPLIKKFAEVHQREYHSAHRAKQHGGFRIVMDSVHPGLHARLLGEVDLTTLDSDVLKIVLLERFFGGEPVSTTELRHSPWDCDRFLYRQVLALNQTALIRGSSSYTSIAAKITGLGKNEIALGGGARKVVAGITESLVEFVCVWAPLLDISLDWTKKNKKVSRNGDGVKFLNGGNECRADLRIGNQPIEVKYGTSFFTSGFAQDIIDRYSPNGGNNWLDGAPFQDSVAIFFMRPDLYQRSANSLRDSGVAVVPHGKFSKQLIGVVSRLRRSRFSQLIKDNTPRVHDLGCLLRLDQTLAKKPSLLLREGHDSQRGWFRDVLVSLNNAGHLLREGGSLGNIVLGDTDTLEDAVGGRVVRYSGGRFLRLDKTGEELGAAKVEDYVEKHRDGLVLARIKEKFPWLKRFTKREMLFLDIETSGLRPTSPIISISLTTIGDDVQTQCLVARDYSEEGSMLEYFFNLLGSYNAFFTFNGSSFDFPRLTSRARQHGISIDGVRTLTEILDGRHVDLYQALRRRTRRLPDAKLKTVEKLVFGYGREGDVASRRIPGIYRGYVSREGSVAAMGRIVSHNMIDTLSLVGLLEHICLHYKS